MTFLSLTRTAALAALICGAMTAVATAQVPGTDPHHPGATPIPDAAPATPGGMPGNDQDAQPQQPGSMSHGMMGQEEMHGMMQRRMAGAPMGMRGHMMKVMFAIADTDGDGGLSFGELTSIQKRIFDQVDANKDEKVTPEEVQAFMRH